MTRCTSRSVTSLATARSSVATPLIAESALATAMIRPRHPRGLPGPEHPGVHAQRDDAHPIRAGS